MKYITVKCPKCHIELGVKIKEEKQKRNVECPICHGTFNPLRTINDELGVLLADVAGVKQKYELREGKNVIGRYYEGSDADFKIDTQGDMFMSRKHLVVNVVYKPEVGFVHYVWLFSGKVNPTFLNNERINVADKLKLNSGDILKLPGATVEFVLSNSEATVLT